MPPAQVGHPLQPKPLPDAWNVAINTCTPPLSLLVTNPFDCAKTRLQTQNPSSNINSKGNVAGTLLQMVRTEGAGSIYRGLTANMFREMSFNLGYRAMFPYVLKAFHEPAHGPPSYLKLWQAGSVCGVIGAITCQPFELIKTRLQFASAASAGQTRSGLVAEISSLARNEGLKGFCRGLDVSCLRFSIMGGINMANQVKMRQVLTEQNWSAQSTNLIAGALAPIPACIIGCPVDVIRNRMYTQPRGADALYRNPVDAMVKMLSQEGPRSFFKGLVPFLAFICPKVALVNIMTGYLGLKSTKVWNDWLEDAELKGLFYHLDHDKSGVLERDEILDFYKEIHPTILPTQDLRNELDRLLEEAGVTSEGQSNGITIDKFRSVAPVLRQRMHQYELSVLFHQIDADGNGCISKEELRSCFLQICRPRSKNAADSVRTTADEIFHAIDANKDGKISFEEYLGASEKLQHLNMDAFVRWQLERSGHEALLT